MRELRSTIVTLLVATIALGLLYPLAMTALGGALFGDRAGGSLIERDGEVVGSRLLGQSFAGDDDYFQSRPSVTGYAADATAFSNLGPNSRRLANQISARADRYLAREGSYASGLTRSRIPPDAVMSSGSGVDPQISLANASIQANRIAAVRGLPLDEVERLIDEHTANRQLGLLGEPGVNVLELNLALDQEDGG